MRYLATMVLDIYDVAANRSISLMRIIDRLPRPNQRMKNAMRKRPIRTPRAPRRGKKTSVALIELIWTVFANVFQTVVLAGAAFLFCGLLRHPVFTWLPESLFRKS